MNKPGEKCNTRCILARTDVQNVNDNKEIFRNMALGNDAFITLPHGRIVHVVHIVVDVLDIILPLGDLNGQVRHSV